MDKAKPKDQIIPGRYQECSHDADLGGGLRLSDACVSEILVESVGVNAAEFEAFAAQSVHA